MEEPIELDVTSIERRERHLWVVTLLLLFLFAGVTTVTSTTLVDIVADRRRETGNA